MDMDDDKPLDTSPLLRHLVAWELRRRRLATGLSRVRA